MPNDLEKSTKLESVMAIVELKTNSFLVSPSNGVRFPLIGGTPIVRFVITPQQIGRRRILVRSHLDMATVSKLGDLSESDSLDITVPIDILAEPGIMGISGARLQMFQLVAGSVGLPGLMAVLLTLFVQFVTERRATGRRKSGAKATRIEARESAARGKR